VTRQHTILCGVAAEGDIGSEPPSLDAYNIRPYFKFASAGRTASAERDSPACAALVDFN